ncbi:MAG: DUF2333 family protein [Alphaproteobacteria bacterium]|nr:DUF2333 family protein [Alphaproteobacteria bacterium]
MKENFRGKLQTVWKKITQDYWPLVKEKGKNALERGRLFVKKLFSSLPEIRRKTVSFILKWWHFGLGILFAFLVLYYPVGAFITHHIDADPAFPVRQSPQKPVLPDTLAALVGREISTHMFTPNKPFFFPAAALDNMPAFQTGIIMGIKNVTDILSIVNAQSEALSDAAERLAYSPAVWHVQNWKPAVSSVKKYKKAKELLTSYQTAAAQGKETFNISKEALESIIAQIIRGTEECVEALEQQAENGSQKVWDFQADNVFYNVKGQAYVYFLALRDLKEDFETLFVNETLEKERLSALKFLEKSVRLQPAAVVNGAPVSQAVPNHLLNAGFYLSRAVSELKNMEQTLWQTEDE